MPHADLRNHTRFAEAVLPLADENGRALLVPLLQATFEIDALGGLHLLDEQPAIDLAGTFWPPLPGADQGAERSVRMEPQIAFAKPACDVVLLAHAVAPASQTKCMLVEFAVGGVRQSALVSGERRLLSSRKVGTPAPFDRVALRYEHAFGGADLRSDDRARQRVDSRNPIGRGMAFPGEVPDPEWLMPQVEDPTAPLTEYGQVVPVAGFGFIASHWQPRAGYSGTYDAGWLATRMPLLPRDFDRRYFNAAPPALVCAQSPAGGERVDVVGTTSQGRIGFSLPELGTPLFHAAIRRGPRQTQKMRLDTIVVDTDAMRLTLLWRAQLLLRDGVHGMIAGEFHLPDARARRYFRQA